MKRSARGRRSKNHREQTAPHTAPGDQRRSPFIQTADPPKKRSRRLIAAVVVWLACIAFLAYLMLTA